MNYFADTYALVEIINGSSSHKKYLQEILITTKLHLMELYYHCLREHSKEIADYYLSKFLPFCITISSTSIKIGMEFKLKYKKEKLSYADCIGYALALENKMKFLTGDEKFENKLNVEFVK